MKNRFLVDSPVPERVCVSVEVITSWLITTHGIYQSFLFSIYFMSNLIYVVTVALLYRY